MKRHRICATIVLAALIGGVAQGEVLIDTVTIGNPGNAGELSGGGFSGPERVCGAVNYPYNIGKYEVTAGQYTEFLNAVAETDAYGLYDENMAYGYNGYGCRIQRDGSPGSYWYSVADNWANRPVNYVSYWDACRFANWLHNGQPTGPQRTGTTETGAYTLNGYNGNDGREIQRNPGWDWAVPSEDEWYKAAYHKNDGATGDYYDYSTGSDIPPSNELIDPDPGNNATFCAWGNYTIGSPYYRTEAGAHENSVSPYGTFDQGGNVYEWNEAVIAERERGFRGGSFLQGAYDLHASTRYHGGAPGNCDFIGFRVVQVPEPTTLSLLVLAALAMTRRRRR